MIKRPLNMEHAYVCKTEHAPWRFWVTESLAYEQVQAY